MEHLTLFFYYIKGEISGNYISDVPDMLPLALSHVASPLLQHIGKAGFNITAHSECRNLFEPLKEPVWRNSHYFFCFFIWFTLVVQKSHTWPKKNISFILSCIGRFYQVNYIESSKTSSHLIKNVQYTAVANKLNKFTLISKLKSPHVLAGFSIHPDVFMPINIYRRLQGLDSI